MKKIAKKLSMFMATATACVFVLSGCGGGGGGKDPNSSSTGGGGSSVSNPITVDPLDLGEEFNSAYYPVKEKIEQRDGKIDVVILFDGSEKGWEAMANEYMRLHGGAVYVNLNTKYSSGNYQESLKYEITNSNTDWDIVQGNLATNLINQYCINMYTYVNGKNAYAGDKTWSNVIEEDAYITDKSGTNTSTYIMNSENLLTAWFVNTVALKAAADKGYVNAEGKVANPVTWDDLMNLCAKMQEAGYKYPLGVSVNSAGIDAYNFSWLLRIYGDYYFRNEYDGIMSTEKSAYVYDPTSQNPEFDVNYGPEPSRLFHKILATDSDKYIGPKSAKFKEFLAQIGKMRPYFNTVDAAQTSMEDLRDAFQTQSRGKESPQIVLDYSGTGLSFLSSQNDNLQVDFFDYPYMVSEGNYIPEGTIVRDVGGNGGYLSIVDHDAKQDALNLDFMKFVMSPYGQSIYYDALSKTDFAPKGLTLVKQNLVKVPAVWKEFFVTDKISFTGLVDSNEFVRNMVVNIGGQNLKDVKIELYQKYLVGMGEDRINIDTFSNRWADALLGGWTKYAQSNSWNVNCYKYFGMGTSYGGE